MINLTHKILACFDIDLEKLDPPGLLWDTFYQRFDSVTEIRIKIKVDIIHDQLDY